MEEKNVEIGEKENGGERNVKMRCERDWAAFSFSHTLYIRLTTRCTHCNDSLSEY